MSDWDINEFLATYRPPERTVPVTMRGDLLGELSRLEDELQRLREAQDDGDTSLSDGAIIEIAQKITNLRQEVRDSSRVFRVVSIGDRAWSDLMAKHPPRDEDRKEGLPWNIETFYADALSQCVAEPNLTPAEADKLMEMLSATQVRNLVSALLDVNGGQADELPKSNAPFVLRQLSKEKSNTAPHGESLDLSSLAGQ